MKAPVRALALLLLAALLGGCSSLPFFGKKDDAASEEKAPEPLVQQYEFEVEAPDPSKKLLADFLDLARFQKVPKADAPDQRELDRLVAAAPTQARQLLETEGYFDAEVKVAQSTAASGLPRIVLTVEPGPRVIVKSLSIASATPLAPREPTRDDAETSRLEVMRRDWKMKPGEPFTQSGWSGSKTTALGELRAGGYPKADWQSTHAKIDATDRTAALDVTVESGPLFRFGPIRVNGINRYDEAAVRRLAGFTEGEVYTEKALLDYQERLIKVGLFQGASVTLAAEAGPPEAAPVTVDLKELEQNQATFGIGYSTNTGPRFSIDHYNRAVFGWKYIAHNTLVFGPSLKSLGTDFTSYPLDDFKRNLFGAKIEQLKTNDETRNAGSLRAGRSQDLGIYSRLYYGELSHTRVESDYLTTTADAVAGHYHWVRRDVDNPLLPTRGTVLQLQGAVGYGVGHETRTGLLGEERAYGPLARAFVQLNAYRPLGSWFLNGRLEAGQVFTRSRISVPDTLLFRAGGDESVRGYGYRDLGPEVNGATVGGRVLLTGTIEAEHAIISSVPALLGAVFIDAGNAADRWSELNPVLGYGVGVHFRSPVGVLRLDLAYGQAVKSFRVHFSVGVVY